MASQGKRLFVYAPEIKPHTFLFFFQRSADEKSYSLRDYSSGLRCDVIRGVQLPFGVSEIRKIRRKLDMFSGSDPEVRFDIISGVKLGFIQRVDSLESSLFW
ncbi:MAG: hypothetical protein ACE5JX_15320 [Acidobacteriota bacterium]